LPRLQVLNGKRQGAVFDVGHGVETLIGHRQSATIAIDDPWVSWDHARLFFNGDGGCWIEDLGSTNGTFVNCVRVKREVLRHEDIIFLGKTHVIFLSPAEEHSGGPGFGVDDPFSSAPAVPATRQGSNRFSPPIVQSPSSSIGNPQHQQHPAHLPSSAGPFRSDSGTPPLRDPFASGGTPASAWPAPQKAKKDPFADSSVDPFSSGPDFAARPLVPPPAPTPSQVDPGRARRAFADTNADDEVLGPPPQPAPGQPRKLSISELNEDLGAATKTTPVHEISQLIEGYDDLDTILGDGRARTPDPAFARPQPRLGQPSEMRTRPIDTDAAREILAEEDRRGSVGPRPSAATPRQVPPTVGLPAVNFEPSSANAAPILPPVSQAPRQPAPAAPPPSAPPAASEDTFPGPQLLDPGALAFERARLEDEVRRLRAAMQAAREKSPQAIKIAAEALRDLELGRLARKVAELERDMMRLRNELAEKQAELDGVTDEMIEKEDRIDGLEAELRRARGARAQALGASTDADLGAM
jgi:hypothetical protein